MHLTMEELNQGIDNIKQSPKESGTVELIVCRPGIGEREELATGELDLVNGLVGDNWLARGFKKNPDGAAHPDMQLNLMNARAIALIASSKERWKLAGDQFFVDLDLSPDNLPPGTRLSIGDAEIEITAEPHLGCKKFSQRFGRDAALFVNSTQGKALNLRGVNAKVTKPGIVAQGAQISKLNASSR
ncbi:MAG: MOSC domain-containing protein [Kangiellaceae bacterium]|nr:MOSC domain-containing protein [Kangiellaceae bacterium]